MTAVVCRCGIRPEMSLRELQDIAAAGSCTCPERLCRELQLALHRAERAEHGARRAAGVMPTEPHRASWRRFRRGGRKGAMRRARHEARRLKGVMA